MPQQGVSFGGAYIGLPGAYYQDVLLAGPGQPPVTPPLLFLGFGYGPKPKTPITFTNPTDLLNAIRGGPAAAFVPFLTQPSPQMNGAQQITFIDVSTNTQAALPLVASGALGTAVTLTSTLYGPPSNLLTAQVSAGSNAGVKISLSDLYANLQVVGDNLTAPFDVAYTGAASGGLTYSVVTTGNAPSFILTSPNAGESASLSIASGAFTPVNVLVEAINGTGFWSAQSRSATNGQMPSLLLTPTGSVALTAVSGGVPQSAHVRAYLNEIPFWVNQFASTMASAAVSGSATDVAGWLPVTGGVTFFSGARGIPPVTNDYATGLNVALATPGWTVFCDSNAAAVQALLAQHCIIASSTPYGMWRRGFTGSSIGDSTAFTKQTAIGLDTNTVAYLYPGIYRTDPNTGVNTLYGGLYAAAAAAGMATGNQIAQPLTNKVISGTGVELIGGSALTTSQLVDLQNTGVMAIYTPLRTGVPTILSDVDTWQVDGNVENTSFQQIACRFWLAYSITNFLQQYVGTIASPITEAAILNSVKGLLNNLIYVGGNSNGVLSDWVKGSLSLVYNGQNMSASISFTCSLVGQNKYILVTGSIAPLSFTISVA